MRRNRLLIVGMLMVATVFTSACCGDGTNTAQRGGSTSMAKTIGDKNVLSDAEEPEDDAQESATPEATAEATATPTPVPTEKPLTPEEQRKIKSIKKTTPKAPKCENSNEKKIKISWKKVPDATGYIVFRSKKKAGPFKEVKRTKKLYYKDKKTKARNEYFYKIKGYTKVRKKEYTTKKSKKTCVYVMPKAPRTVITGECFVQDLIHEKSKFTKHHKFVYKIGINTYTMLTSNYFKYNGQSVTCIEKVATHKPDRVFFLVGANECTFLPKKTTMNDFAKIRKLLRKVNKHVQMVLIAIPPFKRGTRGSGTRPSFNRAYKAFADKYDDVYYCTATNALQDSSGYLQGKYDGGDGTHWNFRGGAVVASELKKWSKKYLKNW